jgi:outer membrane immunogenic protein
MRSFWLGLSAATLLVSAANSADLRIRPVYKAPPIVSAPFSWSGFYVGANLGYNWGSTSGTITVAGPGTGPISGSGSGMLGGLQAGYNWQTGPIIFGVETDIQANGARGTVTGFPGGAAINATGSQPWFGTVRGRLGYAVDGTMIYVTGGGLYGEGKLRGTITTTGPFTSTANFWTYTVGGGVETMFAPKWSAKLEYLYAGTPDNVPLPPNTTAVTGSAHGNIVRAGINYHF